MRKIILLASALMLTTASAIADGKWLADSVISVNADGTNRDKNLYAYDSYGNRTLYEYYTWDKDLNDWVFI